MRRLHTSAPATEVHPTYARLLCLLLQSQDFDPAAVLAEAGLDAQELASADFSLSHEATARLIAAATRALQMPWLGLDLGASVSPSAHGATGYAVLHSRDLRQALESAVRYGSLRHTLLGWKLRTREDGGLTLVVFEAAPLGPARQVVLDVVFAVALQIMATVSGRAPDAVQVDLPFAAPAWRSRYERCGAGALRFDQPDLAFHVPAAMLSLPCPTADVQAYESACRDCDLALARQAAPSSRQQVQAWLRGARSEARYPRLTELAARMQLSARTLTRRLKDEGSSYQDLLDEERQQQALWFLQNSSRPVEEVAALLGYADTSNFSRTCRRWFGCTPASLRR